MKICLASWAPFIGGAEVAVERLAKGLQDSGHEVVLVAGHDGDAFQRFRRSGIRCMFIPQQFTGKRHWLRYRRARNQFVDLLRRELPDIVHANDLPTHQMASDAARRVDIPHVCHHRWIFEGAAIDWLNKFGADRHLFVSESLMDQLCLQSPRLAASPRSVVPDGLPLPPLPSETDRQDARTQLGLPHDKKIVLFAGQVVHHKGVADLIHAWHKLGPAVHAEAMLVLVGEDLASNGQYRREMEQLAVRLECPVRFVGFQQDVGRWMIASDVVVVPSHAEPFGLVVLEAMAYTRPVIGTNVGGIPGMIVDQQTGLLVPPASPGQLAIALKRLLGDRSLRQRLGQQARQRCGERFSLNAHVANVIDQYRIVLHTHPSPAAS